MGSAGATIREVRISAGVTQAELARRLGTTQPAIARLERSGSNPTLDTVDDALRVMGHRLELVAHRQRRGLDEAQIAERLRLSPAQRLKTFQASQGNLGRLRRLARRVS